MTKQLREWKAPDGRRWRWNVDWVTWQHQSPLGWHALTAAEYADLPSEYRDALNALRADPYVPVKGLREQIAVLIGKVYSVGRGDYIRDWAGFDAEADALLTLLDRERPAIQDVDGEALVAELVRRGWHNWNDVTCIENDNVAHKMRHPVSVLQEPERAG